MKDLPVRKKIRLEDFDYSSSGCYFITICVKDRHEMLGRIVGDDAHIVPPSNAHIVPPYVEYSEYGNIVLKYVESINISYTDIAVDKYVIMPNHIHLILIIRNTVRNSGTMWASSPTATRIPSVMRSLKTLVAKKCGFSFWQRSYHDHIIRNEAEYQKIWQYIDENPARWKEDCYYKQITSQTVNKSQ